MHKDWSRIPSNIGVQLIFEEADSCDFGCGVWVSGFVLVFHVEGALNFLDLSMFLL